jgi:2-polyprenyl-3-methyl-5-hydroxy-6-metoxy-1,4-benzoquinol methylase
MKSFIKFGSKKADYYKGILIKADSGLHTQVMSVLTDSVPRSATILDMGAGEGAMSQRMFDFGYKVVATEIDKENFKAKGPEFIQINFNDTNQMTAFVENRKGFFDVVICMEVIEHVENAWKYIRLLKKVLKNSGKLIVTTPNIASWLSRFFFMFTGTFLSFNDQTANEYGHVSPISPWELQLIFKREGFQNIKTLDGGFLPSVWITSSFLITISVLLSFFFRPFMKGNSRGWCVIIVGDKKAL